jgi:hypothetical protein
MERLFSPCKRLRNLLRRRAGRLGPREILQELNLDIPTLELISAERGFTYADLYATLGNEATLAWLTPHAAVTRDNGSVSHYWGRQRNASRNFRFNADGENIYALALSPEHSLEICDVVLRLLAASVVHSVILDNSHSHYGALISAPSLAYLLEQCQSLKFLSLEDLEMDENHCRALGAYSRPGLEIVLTHCAITGAGTSVLAEVLGRNQGPTKLFICAMDNVVIADGLRGNSRLKIFRPLISSIPEDGNRQVLAIAGALKENKGLVTLDLRNSHLSVSDETWGAVCDSLKTHPTLEVLNLHSTDYDDAPLAPAALKALLDTVKVNLSIHTINLRYHYRQHEIFLESVLPYLETNRFRPRVRAIQKARPIPYRAKVLGRALLAVRSDPNRFWMLLSGNTEVAFPSTTVTTTPTANLPTPATAAATSNVASVVATGVVTRDASSRVASSTGSSAVDIVATPNVGRKRKARPQSH